MKQKRKPQDIVIWLDLCNKFSGQNVEIAYDGDEYTMADEEKEMGEIALEIVQKGEDKTASRIIRKFDWSIFCHFVGIWILTGAVLLSFQCIIALVKGSENVLRDVVKEIDMLSMSFSLVLSALLEQVWSKKEDKSNLYGVTLGAEAFCAFFGVMLYMTYSILKIVSPSNNFLKMTFELNLGYSLLSSASVLLGFLSRSMVS